MGQQRSEHCHDWQSFHYQFQLTLLVCFQHRFPLIPTEPDLMQVAGQMLFPQIMKDALPGPFEYRVKPFGCVVVDITTCIRKRLFVRYPPLFWIKVFVISRVW